MTTIFFFSHIAQIKLYTVFAEAFKEHFDYCRIVLFVHGESDKRYAMQFKQYDEIIDFVEGFHYEENLKTYHVSSSDALRALEHQLNQSFFWEDITVDRWARSKNCPTFTMQYLNFAFDKLHTAYMKHRPLCGFGESTAAIYRLAHHLFDRDDRLFMVPICTRYFDRFYIETDWSWKWKTMNQYYQTYLRLGVPEHLHEIIHNRYESITQKQAKPMGFESYAYKKGFNEFKVRDMKKYFSIMKNTYAFDRREIINNIRLASFEKGIFSKLKRYYGNMRRYQFFDHLALKKIPEGIKFCTYFLHFQPEYTIDSLGRFYRNQEHLIANIASALPIDHFLLVKEHMPMIGLRPQSFYKEILKNTNVILLHSGIDSHQLIKQSSLVMTVTGSAALEASLLKTPSIVFGEFAYSNISLVSFCSDLWQLKDLVRQKINTGSYDNSQESLALLAAKHEASSPGQLPTIVALIDSCIQDGGNCNAIKQSFKKELTRLYSDSVSVETCI